MPKISRYRKDAIDFCDIVIVSLVSLPKCASRCWAHLSRHLASINMNSFRVSTNDQIINTQMVTRRTHLYLSINDTMGCVMFQYLKEWKQTIIEICSKCNKCIIKLGNQLMQPSLTEIYSLQGLIAICYCMNFIFVYTTFVLCNDELTNNGTTFTVFGMLFVLLTFSVRVYYTFKGTNFGLSHWYERYIIFVTLSFLICVIALKLTNDGDNNVSPPNNGTTANTRQVNKILLHMNKMINQYHNSIFSIDILLF